MNTFRTARPDASLNCYLPAPKNGQQCPISGMGHARFYTKVINGEGRKYVRIVDMKEPNQIRGTKFYHAGDLLSWLNSMAAKNGGMAFRAGKTEKNEEKKAEVIEASRLRIADAHGGH